MAWRERLHQGRLGVEKGTQIEQWLDLSEAIEREVAGAGSNGPLAVGKVMVKVLF